MTDGVNIDWSLLKPPPDLATGYVNAFRAGRSLAQEQGVTAASQQYATDPQGAINAMRGFDPDRARQMAGDYQASQDRQSSVDEATAESGGDYPGAMKAAAGRGATGDVMDLQKVIQNASDQQREQMAQRASNMARIMISIQGQSGDPNERLAIAQHMASLHPEYQIDPKSLTPDQFTDGAMSQSISGAMSIEQLIKAHAPMKAGENIVDPAQLPGSIYQGGGATGAPTPQGASAPAQGPSTPLQTAILGQESGNNDAVGNSAKGAVGPGQVMPATFAKWAKPGEDIHDPAANRAVSARIISSYEQQYGDPARAAVAYFSGPANVAPAGSPTPWLHDRSDGHTNVSTYVRQVLGRMGGDTSSLPYQVASNGPGVLYSGGSGGGGAHMATPQEVQAAGLPPKTQAWVNGKGEIGDLPKGIAGQQGIGDTGALGDTTKTGADYLATIPAADRPIVQALIDGRNPFPTGMALRNPAIAKYWQEAAQYDPSFDAANFPARAATRKDATSGKMAANITSMNTLLGHLQSLQQAADRLNNVAVSGVGGLINAAKNSLQDPGTGALSAAQQIQRAVASEAARTFQGGAPHETEILHNFQNLDLSKSPQQINASIGALGELLESRLQALRDQYRQGMGTTAHPLEAVHPYAAQIMQRLRALREGPQQGPAGGARERTYNPQTGALE